MQITVPERALREAITEYHRRLDTEQHWIAVRVSSDGHVYVSVEPSKCYSEDEYFHRMPHTVTVLSASGHGQCNLEDGWEDTDEFCDTLADDVAHCVEEMEAAGYEVELDEYA